MMLDSLIKFTQFTVDFRNVKRVMRIPGTDDWENDAEHSFQLALVAWYLINADGLDLDLPKVLQFCLAHDLVETIAGDTSIFASEEVLAGKQGREHRAALAIEELYPNFPALHGAIREYEARESREARFVYALDKLLPEINNYLDNGRLWHEKGLFVEDVERRKTPKIAVSPEILPYHKELMSLLRQTKGIFPAKI